MIEMNLDGGYTIRTLDALNIVLEVTAIVTNPKSKNYGSEITRRLGYYGNLKSALRAYATHRLNSEGIQVSRIPEVIDALKSLEETIEKVIGEGH